MRRALSLVLALVLLAAATAIAAPSTSAASPVIYVDGKHGSDSNSGTSLSSPLKTIAAGMWLIRYSGRLEVVGYDDYVYYEKPTRSYWVGASAQNPAVIEAYGYGRTGYIRPIVSGATVVNRPGSTRWSRPNATAYPDVWATSWTQAIPGYESAVNGYRQERLYMDVSQPLARPAQVPTLAQLQASPASQYWDGKTLYVRLGLWGSTLADTNPNHHTIDIPAYNGLLISSGSSYVTIQGFRIRHASMGVGVTGTANHVTVNDVDASYNYPMGFFSASGYNSFNRISGSRNTIQLVKLDNGANHNVVDGATATQNMGQGIKLTGNSTTANVIRNSIFADSASVPSWCRGYGGNSQGIDIEEGAHDNIVEGNVISGHPRGLMLYQNTAAGLPLNGNQIRANTFKGNRQAVVIWDSRTSASASTGTVRFSRNVYDGNTEAIGSEGPTSNKYFDHETIYRTGTAATVDNSAVHLKAGSVTITNSIVSGVTGYAFYAVDPAQIRVSTTTVVGAKLGILAGDVAWVEPGTQTRFVPVGPVRVLDTRSGLGTTGPVWNRSPKTVKVAGVAGIPAGAVAITGNLTVTKQSAAGFVALTVSPTSHPATSTLNFPVGDDRANGITVPLAPDGTISMVFVSSSGAQCQLILDVTGYFVTAGGASYQSVPPARVLDTRSGLGLSGQFTSGQPRVFGMTGVGGVPSGAIAVTGNVTVTGQTQRGFVALTSAPTSTPATSSINFPVGDNRANGVTVPLGPGGTIAAVYMSRSGAKTDLVFDVTGYYLPGTGGASYVPIAPGRLVDSRIGLGVPTTFVSARPQTARISGRYLVPPAAGAVTGNLTVTGQTARGFVAVTVKPLAEPSTSTINFPKGDTRANGFTAPLDATAGTVSATYVAGLSSEADVVVDITGYFLPAGASLGPCDFRLDPKFLSTDQSSSLYLTIDRTSPVYSLGSDGTPLGARSQ